MNDYIKREDAIRAYAEILKSDKDTKLIAEMILADVPSADVVEVVRCKDCKYYIPISEKIGECKDTRMNSTYMSYCSYGERKEK